MSGHAVGVRIPWAQAPAPVHRWVEGKLGGGVIGVIDCVGGMSPGPAARLRTAAGTAAFVKACGSDLNPNTPDLLRAEARVLAALPAHSSLPRLLDWHDDGDWVVLLIEDLPGASPPAPWRRADLARVSAALTEVRSVLDTGDLSDLGELPAAVDSSPIFLTRWRELADRLDRVDPWWSGHHDALADHAERAADLIDGEAVVHWDVRADNVVLTADRTVLVDWGQARRGAAWMDHAMLALDCSMSGSETSTAELAATDPALRDRDPADLLALASGRRHVVRVALDRARAAESPDPACDKCPVGRVPASLPRRRAHTPDLTPPRPTRPDPAPTDRNTPGNRHTSPAATA